jgi:ABC-type Fe3+-hydroxamate transport system substrate-binding protein
MAGREVEITKKVESVAVLHGVVTSYIAALGRADKLVAAPFTSDFFCMIHPVFENIGTVGRGQLDMEALARLNPDLFLHRASDIKTLDAAQGIGIPSVGFMAETRNDITAMLSMLGRILGAEDRAGELIAYYGGMLDKARDISREIPAEKRKSAIVMGTQPGSVANGAMLQSFMIETAGGINSAKDIVSAEIWPVVGTETIFGWNPDFIFITNNSQARYNAETLMTDPAWANLAAVKEKHVYLVPADKDSWEFPGISSALGSLWMLSAMYPDKISREQIDAEAKAFYKSVYNLDVTPELLGY